MTNEKIDELLKILKDRFEKNLGRHKNIVWNEVEAKLKSNTQKLKSLNGMEESGGEPDIVGIDNSTNEFIFMDCSKETPKGRTNLCYDREALDSRKTFKPKNSVMDLAKEIGIELLTEDEYKFLQTIGEFDLKTSSWVKTPEEIRKLGGALFGDRRFNNVFIYHNGVESYYQARGFRGSLRV